MFVYVYVPMFCVCEGGVAQIGKFRGEMKKLLTTQSIRSKDMVDQAGERLHAHCC